MKLYSVIDSSHDTRYCDACEGAMGILAAHLQTAGLIYGTITTVGPDGFGHRVTLQDPDLGPDPVDIAAALEGAMDAARLRRIERESI